MKLFVLILISSSAFAGWFGLSEEDKIKQFYPLVTENAESGIVNVESFLEFNKKVCWETLTPISRMALNEFQLYEALKKASEYTLSKNKKYFALINDGANNLSGFPINNYLDLKNYCFAGVDKKSDFFISTRTEKCKDISPTNHNITKLHIKVVDDIVASDLHVWDAKAVLVELK